MVLGTFLKEHTKPNLEKGDPGAPNSAKQGTSTKPDGKTTGIKRKNTKIYHQTSHPVKRLVVPKNKG